MHLAYLNGDGGIPIRETLKRYPLGMRGAQRVVLEHHCNGGFDHNGCYQVIAEVQWMIRPDGSVGCTPGWEPFISSDGKLVMFSLEAT